MEDIHHKWLCGILEERFGIADPRNNDAGIRALQPRDWLYIYAETMLRYGKTLMTRYVREGCFNSYHELSEAILESLMVSGRVKEHPLKNI